MISVSVSPRVRDFTLYSLTGGGALLVALIAMAGNHYVLWWLAFVMLIPLLFHRLYDLRLNGYVLTVLAFFAWIEIHQVLLDPAVGAQQQYFVPQGLTAFLVFAGLPVSTSLRLGRVALAVALAFAALGLIQHYVGVGLVHSFLRAHATFATPNSLATFINLFLIPLSVLFYFCGGRRLLAITLVLWLGLLATQSKGGLLTIVVTGAAFVIFLVRTQKVIRWNRVVLLLAISIAAVFVESQSVNIMSATNPDRLSSSMQERMAESLGQGDPFRLDHYRIAATMIEKKWFLGHGLLNYKYVHASERGDLFGRVRTNFVHNDYLQFWAESGLPGVFLFVSMFVVLLGTIVRRWDGIRSVHRKLLIAATFGIGSAYVHAQVDFPFWIPPNLLVIGALMGMCARILAKGNVDVSVTDRVQSWLVAHGMRAVVLGRLATLFLATVLAFPWVSQEALRHSGRASMMGDTDTMLRYLRIARAFAPYEAANHWVEAEVWRVSARTLNRKDLALLADRLYESGAKANPYDPHSVYFRLRMHLHDRDLLDSPVDGKVMLEWARFVLERDPRSMYYRVAYANALRFVGRTRDAEVELNALKEIHAGTKFKDSARGLILIMQ